MGVSAKLKCRSVRKKNVDHAVIAGLDHVTFVNKIANSWLSDYNVRARDGDKTHYRLQFANGRRTHRPLSGGGARANVILCSGGNSRHTSYLRLPVLRCVPCW